MDHLLLRNVLIVGLNVAGGIGCFFLTRYAYKTCQSQTPFEKRARRVIPWFWPLNSLWQACLALHFPALHAPWIPFAGGGLLILLIPTVLLFLFVQTKRQKQAGAKP